MTWFALLGISIGLAMDAFAVAVAAGLALATVTPRHVFRLAFHFGLFQFLMPVIGWLAGNELAGHIGKFAPWLAFGLLAYVGGKMVWQSQQPPESRPEGDPTRGIALVGLSIATSLDALAVGLSLAFLGEAIWLPSVIIGLVAAALTAVGILFGARLGPRWGTRAEMVGGCVLLLIGVRIVTG